MAALALLLLLSGAVLLWYLLQPNDPLYQGKPLSEWLSLYTRASHAQKTSDQALRAAGSNGIPLLLKMLQAHDTPLERKWMRLLSSQRWVKFRFQPASDLILQAQIAFMELGPIASNAVPNLIEIYRADISDQSRGAAATALSYLGPAAQAALPTLIADFAGPYPAKRTDAVEAACRIGGNAELLVPALRRALKDPELEVRAHAANGLILLGDAARPALPELIELLDDPPQPNGDSIRYIVEKALWWVAPEYLPNALVAGGAELLVKDGITIQNIVIEQEGVRHTIVPTGTAVPCKGLLWSFAPRKPFRVYARDFVNVIEHLIGEFQLDPTILSGKPQLFCAVTEEQIYLCARESSQALSLRRREVSLETSRVSVSTPVSGPFPTTNSFNYHLITPAPGQHQFSK